MSKTRQTRNKTVNGLIALLAFGLCASAVIGEVKSGIKPAVFEENETTLFSPTLEWSVENPSWEGNPFDVAATAVFGHESRQETRTTQMFHTGGKTWKFRFTGTRVGRWTFSTRSDVPGLNGHSGTVAAKPNPDTVLSRGFVGKQGNRWAWTGSGQVFVPQLVMYVGGHTPQIANLTEEQLDADIREFLVEHGFNGFHVPVMLPDAWMTSSGGDADPRMATFQNLELIIGRTYAAGGMVHLWMWGDEGRKWTPSRWDGGKNGSVDRRLQRYIAARLGPLPGWSAGYGFDLWEWVKESDLKQWHAHMHQHFGWPHMLGGRASKNRLDQICEGLDYSGYEQHRPDYDKYVETIEKRPDKPSFSEDRFRIGERGFDYKGYDETMTRRGLYHSTMAGGVANIWGNLLPRNDTNRGSAPYPKKHWIRTYATFFEGRFLNDMVRNNGKSGDSNTRVLRSGSNRLIFYREDAESIHLDLSAMDGPKPAVAVDTTKEYTEIDVGTLKPAERTWRTPYRSDWAIAVGAFGQ